MRYLLNADDFGGTEAINEAIVDGFDRGFLSRTSVMVNKPAFDQALRLAEEHRFKEKVGLHLNLTSGKPLTEPIRHISTFCRESGSFNGKIFRSKRLKLFLLAKEREAVRIEISAQIEKFLQSGFVCKNADSHGHIHTFPSLQPVVLKTMAEYGFDSVRISANLHRKGLFRLGKRILNIRLFHFNLRHGNKVLFFDSLQAVLAREAKLNARKGICEIMLHPNLWSGEVKISESLRYEDIAKSIRERQV